MCFFNGFVSGDKPDEGIKITAVKPLPDNILLITFYTGEQRLFDTKILHGPVFQRLKEDEVFFNPVIEHGVVTWDDGAIDCAPEYMYDHSLEYANDEPYKSYHDLLKEKRNAEYLAKLDRSYNQLASGDVIIKSMNELECIGDE